MLKLLLQRIAQRLLLGAQGSLLVLLRVLVLPPYLGIQILVKGVLLEGKSEVLARLERERAELYKDIILASLDVEKLKREVAELLIQQGVERTLQENALDTQKLVSPTFYSRAEKQDLLKKALPKIAEKEKGEDTNGNRNSSRNSGFNRSEHQKQ